MTSSRRQWRSAGGVSEQLLERDRLPVLVDRCVGEAFADGGRPLELARLDQARDHRGGDRCGDAAEVPLVAELDRHAAGPLSLAVHRGGDDFPVDGNHRGEADEFLLFRAGR